MTTTFALMVPVVIGLVEVVKRVGLNTRYAPLLAVILGVAGSWYFAGHDTNSMLNGLVAGLTACGLWSGVKTSANI